MRAGESPLSERLEVAPVPKPLFPREGLIRHMRTPVARLPVVYTATRCLPLKRRALMTLRPPGVCIRAMNPCRRSRRRFFGCHVRLGTAGQYLSTFAEGRRPEAEYNGRGA